MDVIQPGEAQISFWKFTVDWNIYNTYSKM